MQNVIIGGIGMTLLGLLFLFQAERVTPFLDFLFDFRPVVERINKKMNLALIPNHFTRGVGLFFLVPIGILVFLAGIGLGGLIAKIGTALLLVLALVCIVVVLGFLIAKAFRHQS